MKNRKTIKKKIKKSGTFTRKKRKIVKTSINIINKINTIKKSRKTIKNRKTKRGGAPTLTKRNTTTVVKTNNKLPISALQESKYEKQQKEKQLIEIANVIEKEKMIAKKVRNISKMDKEERKAEKAQKFAEKSQKAAEKEQKAEENIQTNIFKYLDNNEKTIPNFIVPPFYVNPPKNMLTYKNVSTPSNTLIKETDSEGKVVYGLKVKDSFKFINPNYYPEIITYINSHPKSFVMNNTREEIDDFNKKEAKKKQEELQKIIGEITLEMTYPEPLFDIYYPVDSNMIDFINSKITPDLLSHYNNTGASVNAIDSNKKSIAYFIVNFLTLLIHCVDNRHDFPRGESNIIIIQIINQWIQLMIINQLSNTAINSSIKQAINQSIIIINTKILNDVGLSLVSPFTKFGDSFCAQITTSSGTFDPINGHHVAELLEKSTIQALNELLDGICLKNPSDSFGMKVNGENAKTFIDNTTSQDHNNDPIYVYDSGKRFKKGTFSQIADTEIKTAELYTKNKIDGCSGTYCDNLSSSQLNTTPLCDQNNKFACGNYTNIMTIYHLLYNRISPPSEQLIYYMFGDLFQVQFDVRGNNNFWVIITNRLDGTSVQFNGTLSVDLIASKIGITPPRGNDKPVGTLTSIPPNLSNDNLKAIAMCGKTFGDHSSITINNTTITTVDGFIKHQASVESIKRVVNSFCERIDTTNIGLSVLENKRGNIEGKFYQYFEFLNRDGKSALIIGKLKTAVFLNSEYVTIFKDFISGIIAKIETMILSVTNPFQYLILLDTQNLLEKFITEMNSWELIIKQPSVSQSELLKIPDFSYFFNNDNENPCLNRITENILEKYETNDLSEMMDDNKISSVIDKPVYKKRIYEYSNKYFYTDFINVVSGICYINKEYLVQDLRDEVEPGETYAEISINIRDIYYQLTDFLGNSISNIRQPASQFRIESYVSILNNKLPDMSSQNIVGQIPIQYIILCAFIIRALCDGYYKFYIEVYKPLSKKGKSTVVEFISKTFYTDQVNITSSLGVQEEEIKYIKLCVEHVYNQMLEINDNDTNPTSLIDICNKPFINVIHDVQQILSNVMLTE